MQIAVKISDEYLHVKNAKAREEIAMEIAAKIFESNMRDVRQIRDIMKLYNIFHGKKTVDEILEFRSNYLKSEDEGSEDTEFEEDTEDIEYYRQNGLSKA